jgi:hypothetical protein
MAQAQRGTAPQKDGYVSSTKPFRRAGFLDDLRRNHAPHGPVLHSMLRLGAESPETADIAGDDRESLDRNQPRQDNKTRHLTSSYARRYRRRGLADVSSPGRASPVNRPLKKSNATPQRRTNMPRSEA